jgi:hypothetical protein
MVVHTCNPRTQEAEAGGWPGLHSKALSQKPTNKQKKRKRHWASPGKEHGGVLAMPA